MTLSRNYSLVKLYATLSICKRFKVFDDLIRTYLLKVDLRDGDVHPLVVAAVVPVDVLARPDAFRKLLEHS